MLKKRLIPCIIVKDERVIQSIEFKQYLPIGRVDIAVEFFMRWDVDEIILLDIDASKEGRSPNLTLIKQCSERCFLPLTVGGGISTITDIRNVIKLGADKIAINHAAFYNPEFISEAATIFGSQCITVSIDYRIHDNFPEVYVDSGKKPTGLHVVEWAQCVEKLGAGEILLNAIERDGMRTGYDIQTIRAVNQAVSVPIIACGGVGQMSHFVEGVLEAGASAVAAANIFQHSEHSTIVAKSTMRKAGIDIRMDSVVKYDTINQII